LFSYELTNNFSLGTTFPELKSPNQVDSYIGTIKDYSKLVWFLASPGGSTTIA